MGRRGPDDEDDTSSDSHSDDDETFINTRHPVQGYLTHNKPPPGTRHTPLGNITRLDHTPLVTITLHLVQAYLTQKKPPPPLGTPYGPRQLAPSVWDMHAYMVTLLIKKRQPPRTTIGP